MHWCGVGPDIQDASIIENWSLGIDKLSAIPPHLWGDIIPDLLPNLSRVIIRHLNTDKEPIQSPILPPDLIPKQHPTRSIRPSPTPSPRPSPIPSNRLSTKPSGELTKSPVLATGQDLRIYPPLAD